MLGSGQTPFSLAVCELCKIPFNLHCLCVRDVHGSDICHRTVSDVLSTNCRQCCKKQTRVCKPVRLKATLTVPFHDIGVLTLRLLASRTHIQGRLDAPPQCNGTQLLLSLYALWYGFPPVYATYLRRCPHLQLDGVSSECPPALSSGAGTHRGPCFLARLVRQGLSRSEILESVSTSGPRHMQLPPPNAPMLLVPPPTAAAMGGPRGLMPQSSCPTMTQAPPQQKQLSGGPSKASFILPPGARPTASSDAAGVPPRAVSPPPRPYLLVQPARPSSTPPARPAPPSGAPPRPLPPRGPTPPAGAPRPPQRMPEPPRGFVEVFVCAGSRTVATQTPPLLSTAAAPALMPTRPATRTTATQTPPDPGASGMLLGLPTQPSWSVCMFYKQALQATSLCMTGWATPEGVSSFAEAHGSSAGGAAPPGRKRRSTDMTVSSSARECHHL
jgi:hypothetical protein